MLNCGIIVKSAIKKNHIILGGSKMFEHEDIKSFITFCTL